MNARSTSRAPRVPAQQGVPAYSSSGRRLRNYSLDAVQRFLALDPPACVAKHNKRTGRVTSIQFFPLPESSSATREAKEKIRRTAHMGQKYSFEQPIDDGSGRRVWGHSRLLSPRTEDVELHLQAIFRAVPLGCLVPEPAPVVSPWTAVEEPLPEPPSPPSNVVTMRPRRPRVELADDAPLLKAA